MKRALLIIDVQNEYFSGALPVTHPAGSLDNILRAADAAKAHGMPMAVIQHTALDDRSPVFALGSPGWELHPAVASLDYDLHIEKRLPGSFTATGLNDWLTKWGVQTVVITGYMTQMCCDTTSRQAFHRGYDVEFLSDATGTLGLSNPAGSITAEDLHRAVLITQAARFATVLSTEEWIAALG